MPPQQNSTLIDDSLDVCPSLLNLNEVLQRYSPIQPIRDSNNNNNHHHDSNNVAASGDNIGQRALRQPPPEHRHQRKQNKQQHCRSGSSRAGHSRRSRSISLYGVNSTVEQGNKEIPIWIDDETRYVSGVTNKTTCNDIIKALIDDEYRDTGTNGDGAKDGAASRDYSDYVITESWRGIERSYDGNMAILPVWKAWSRVHNELRLALKHHKDILDPSKPLKAKNGLSTLRKYFSKLLKFGRTSSKKDAKANDKTTKTKEQCLISSKAEIPDEFLFVILPDNTYDKNKCDKDARPAQPSSQKAKNKNLKPSSEESAQQAEAKLLKEKLYRLSETRASTHKRRNTHTNSIAAASSFAAATSTSASSRAKRKSDKKKALLAKRRASGSSFEGNNCIRRRKDASMRDSIRNKLAQKTSEVDALYDREYALTKTLTNKCRLYHLQNELYTDPGKRLELSVGEIQQNIEACAKEIIQTEHELLELKNDIRQDISIINNLKRLTLNGDGSSACGVPIAAAVEQAVAAKATAASETKDEQMQFVDNIYEFCDNNASMLV